MAKKTFTPIPPMAELPPAEDINVKEVLEKYLSGEIDLICVLGPTASGKTRYAVSLARQINELLASSQDYTPSDGSACEKRATPVLFAADPPEGAGANIKSEASGCQGSVLPPWPQGEGPAPKEWEGLFCKTFQTPFIRSPPQKRICASGSWAYMPFIRLEPWRSPDASPAMM